MVIIKSFTATVIGGLLVLSFEPFDLWYLSPFFLAGLWRLLILESPKNTFVISFFFGLSLWVLGAGWVENSIVNYGGASKLAAYTFVFLIASFLSLFQATSFFFMSLFRLNDHHRLILAFPVFYVFGEYLREFLFTGLPWLYVGYSSLNNFFLNGYIPVIGVFGMSFLICLFASLLGSVIFFQKLRKSHLFLSLVFMSMFALNATWLSTKSWTEKTSSFQAIIVQPNIDVLEKWSRDGQVKSRNYFSKVFFDELIGNENSQEKIIFFWPEVSLPGLFSRFEIFLKKKGVIFINDSKATNVNAAYFALDSMTSPTVWIAGGVDKGNDYSDLIPFVKNKVKAIICLGKDNSKPIEFFSSHCDLIVSTNNMKDAVKDVFKFVEEGKGNIIEKFDEAKKEINNIYK